MEVEPPKKTMRIAVFPGFFNPHLGGHEKYVEEIYSRIVDETLQVDIIVANTEQAGYKEEMRGLNIYRYDCWNILGGTFPVPKPNLAFWRLLSTLRRRKYSVVNTHTRFFTNAIVGTIFSIWTRTYHLHTEHGTSHPEMSNFLIRLAARFYDHTLGWLVIRHATSVTAISNASGEFSKHLGAKNYQLFHNAVDVNFFSPPDPDRRKGSGNILITYVGRLVKAKGVQDLLDAWKNIDQKNIQLHIVGDGPYAPELNRHAALLQNIKFHGNLTQVAILNILQQTNIFINPSYSEGLPTSVLEAGACGCAIVATNVGGTKEIITDEENGLLIQPKSSRELTASIKELIVHSQLRIDLGEKIMDTVKKNFSWDMISQRYRLHINSILESK